MRSEEQRYSEAAEQRCNLTQTPTSSMGEVDGEGRFVEMQRCRGAGRAEEPERNPAQDSTISSHSGLRTPLRGSKLQDSALSTQHSLGAEFELSGVGLHTGELTQVRVKPAAVGEGRYFVRVDLPDAPRIPARLDAVRQTLLSTELAKGEAKVRTVEHLLAALVGMGVDNARIEIEGAEVPLLDGSGKMWVEAIARVGCVSQTEQESQGEQAAALSPFLEEPIWVYQGDAFVAALPAPEIRFSYGIDFDLPAIGNQWYSWAPSRESFAEAIAPARTFGLAHQIEELRAKGLIKGGSLDNALVCSTEGWINPPLRFANEPVRHKILDLVGDLSLLGSLPVAHFLAYKASHNLHIQLAQRILESR